jgi:ATP-binding cassette subfamily C protein CydC
MSRNSNEISSVLKQSKLLLFAGRNQPVIYLGSFIILMGMLLELLGLALLQPLISGMQGSSFSAGGKLEFLFEKSGLTYGFLNFLKLFLLAFTMRTLATLVGQSLQIHGIKHLQKQISCLIYKNILESVETSTIEKQKIGFFVSLAGDEAARAALIVQLILASIQALILASMYTVALAMISLKIFLAIVIFGFFSGVIVIVSQKLTLKLGARALELSKSAGTTFIDGVTGFKALRGLHGTTYAFEKYSSLMSEYMRALRDIDIYSLIIKLAPLLVIFLGLVVGIEITPEIETKNFIQSNSSAILIITALLFRILPTIGQVITCVSRVAAEARSSQNILEWLPKTGNYGKYSDRSLDPKEQLASVSFELVSFTYSEDSPAVLNNFCYKFMAGKSYAILGPSGRGKSTLLELLAGLRHPSKGSISIKKSDGTLADYTRAQALMITQQPFLLTASVGENLTLNRHYHKDPNSEIAVNKSLELALLNDFIRQQNDGIETQLGYQGSGLSGGQKQRLAVARAFYQNRQLIIGDEITSALDASNARNLIKNLKEFCSDKILVLVTHDESLLDLFDEIVRL